MERPRLEKAVKLLNLLNLNTSRRGTVPKHVKKRIRVWTITNHKLDVLGQIQIVPMY